jgi:hypothetical protein
MAAGGMMMATRIPDLLAEIRTGVRGARHPSPWRPLLGVADLAALVMLWAAMCRNGSP